MNSPLRDAVDGATICAISTAPGAGGIAVVRISGSEALTLGSKVFSKPLDTIADRADRLSQACPGVGSFSYPVSFNSHPDVIAALATSGLSLECFCVEDVARLQGAPTAPPLRLIFSPNFCDPGDYTTAYSHGAEVVVNSVEALADSPAHIVMIVMTLPARRSLSGRCIYEPGDLVDIRRDAPSKDVAQWRHMGERGPLVVKDRAK